MKVKLFAFFLILILLSLIECKLSIKREQIEKKLKDFLSKGEKDKARSYINEVIIGLEALQGTDGTLPDDVKQLLVEVYFLSGSMFLQENQLTKTENAFKRAIELNPKFSLGHINLAKVYGRKQDFQAAYNQIQTALKYSPEDPDVHYHMGDLLETVAFRYDDALQYYKQAINIHDHETFRFKLASLLFKMGKYEKSIPHLKAAIKMKPNAEFYSKLAECYQKLQDWEEANIVIKKALALNPTSGEINRVAADIKFDYSARDKDGNFDEAIFHYRKAIEYSPDDPVAFYNFLHATQTLCKWSEWEDIDERVEAFVLKELEKSRSSIPIAQAFFFLSPPVFLKAAQGWAATISKEITPYQHEIETFNSPKIKVGYISRFFEEYPISGVANSLFTLHNRQKFEIYCYVLNDEVSSISRSALKEGADHFSDISRVKSEDIAKKIKADGIQLLIYFDGYTVNHRADILVYQAAPIQISYFGFPATMGAPFIQYFVTDEQSTPPSHSSFFTEKFIYLPNSFFLADYEAFYPSSRFVAKPPRRSAHKLPKDKTIFISWTPLTKLDPILFKSWMTILKEVPDSLLWILKQPPFAVREILRQADFYSIPETRIIFSDALSKEDHLRIKALADIGLDTFRFSTHTAVTDLLWAGVPVVSLALPNSTMSSRLGSSFLKAANLPELIATSYEEYEQMAINLAKDKARLKQIKDQLKKRDSLMFNAQQYVSDFEIGLSEVWERAKQKKALEDIFISNLKTSTHHHDEL